MKQRIMPEDLAQLTDEQKEKLTKLCLKWFDDHTIVSDLEGNAMRTHGMTKEEYIRRHPEHADIYYWGNVPNNKSSKQAHRRAGGTCAWKDSRG